MGGLLTIILAIILIVGVVLALSEKGRYMLKGLGNLFFVDMAKTEKGADIIYTQAIEETENSYVKASNNLQKIAGLLETAKTNLIKANKDRENVQFKMEEFAKKQMFDKVELYAVELSSLDEDVEAYTAEIAKYEPMYSQAMALTKQYETKLLQLKKEKKTVVRQLEINKQTKEMYDDLDELKNVKSSDKLINAVKEGVIETGQVATGARVLHESKHSTKLSIAEQEVKSLKTNSYVEELRKKYSK